MKYKSIIISGPPVSGKSTLAEKLAKIYNWPVYSIGQLWRDEWTKLYPNKEISFEDYWKKITLKNNLSMDKRFKNIIEKGEFIGNMRYGVQYKDPSVLLVLVTANIDLRAKRGLDVDVYKGKSFEEIKKILIGRENNEAKVGKDMYKYDYRDPKHYNLILDSSKLTIEEEISIITNLLPPSQKH
ncbi:MAG: cytidylate kinase family protein [Candidatus Nanoarchaeia archaeon]|nr:cytidylate kinase family protein [Candidatus Nanoarchaeia archaeon]MDD5588344.1 cytidylate kinase family protein [Candidatus Nanoarchaeia archaeon]